MRAAGARRGYDDRAAPTRDDEALEDGFPDEARTTETEVVVAAAEGREGRAVLTLLSGVNAGELFALDRRETVIGRAREAAIRIDSLGLSRRHARVVRAGDAYQIEDLGSTNGVFVNGEPVRRGDLAAGDQVQIGSDIILRFSVVDAGEEALARQLFESSTRDALTGAWSRKYVLARLDAEVAYAERHKVPLAVVMFDLDRFKVINDTHGHAAGDAVLRSVGLVVGGLLRTEDVFARFGGEEFIILLRGSSRENAVRLAEHVKHAVARSRVSWKTGELHVTVSAGVAVFEGGSRGGAGVLLELADRRLYLAKEAGRNTVAASG